MYDKLNEIHKNIIESMNRSKLWKIKDQQEEENMKTPNELKLELEE